MKSLITGFLLFTSVSAFASSLSTSIVEAVKTQAGGPITGEHANNVKKAVVAELQMKTVDCVVTVSAGKGPSSAEVKSQMISIVQNTNTSVSVDDSGTQPAITMAIDWSATEDTIAHFQTSADFKSILSFSVSKDKLTKVERNVGTILSPRFETVTERAFVVKADCTLK